MSSLSDFLGGGGGSSDKVIQREFTFDVTESGTVSLPFAGTVDVYAIGGGGGAHIFQGAGSYNTNNTGNTRGVPLNGGGGGGCAVREGMVVEKGDELVITIGAGGQLVNANNTEANNGAGGDTTVNTNSNNITISLTGGGGSCGGAGVNKKNGSGGTASGGDSNYTGGRGGEMSGTPTNNNPTNFYGYTGLGGGSAAFQADGYAGGDLAHNLNTLINNTVEHFTGGGGIGGAAATLTISDVNHRYGTAAAGGALAAGSGTYQGTNAANTIYLSPAGPAGFQSRNGNNLGDVAHPVGRGGGGRNDRSYYIVNNNVGNTTGPTATDLANNNSGPGAGQEPMQHTVASNYTATPTKDVLNTGPGIFGGKGAIYHLGGSSYGHNLFNHAEAENAFGGGAGGFFNTDATYVLTSNQITKYYGCDGLVRIVYNSFS